MLMSRATLIAGGSGYVGGLVASALLADEDRCAVLPLRNLAKVGECLSRLRLALVDYAPAAPVEDLLRRVTIVALPSVGSFAELDRTIAEFGVDEIIHCAGCLDYFDRSRLISANVELTARLVEAARRWTLDRFIYISTAYCAGFRHGLIPDGKAEIMGARHSGPCSQPDKKDADQSVGTSISRRGAVSRDAIFAAPH
jgi:nucleoside-diphosphate-sugar epimerase